MTISEYSGQVPLELFKRTLRCHLSRKHRRDICILCVNEFSGDRNNRLGRKIGLCLLFVGLLAGEHLAFSVLNPDDARPIIRQQITWLQVAMSVDMNGSSKQYRPGRNALGSSLSCPPVRRSRNFMRHVPCGGGLQPTEQWNGEAPISNLSKQWSSACSIAVRSSIVASYRASDLAAPKHSARKQMIQSIFLASACSHVNRDKSHSLTLESIAPSQVKAILQDACERPSGQLSQQL
jgi:hypothetical protein